MIRLLAALALSLCLAAPAKALVLETGDFLDFRADISGVPDEDDLGSDFDRFDILFTLDPNGGVAGPLGFVGTEGFFGTSLGGSDLNDSRRLGAFNPMNTGTGFNATVLPSDVSGDEIFVRLLVTDGALDVIGVEASYRSSSRRLPVDVSQVSAVPLPASLVLLLSGVGAIGLIGRRRRTA